MKSYCHFLNRFLVIESNDHTLYSIDIVDQKPVDMPLSSNDIQKAFNAYLSHDHHSFTFKLSYTGTDFQKKVFKAMLDISFGEVRSYKDIALAIGHPKAYRAVGQACHINPLPIVIPCHRVVATGHIGGYGYGVELKRLLLDHEKTVQV
jgi:methylated-DNA-[protein]-cysteine S-methyltransferase